MKKPARDLMAALGVLFVDDFLNGDERAMLADTMAISYSEPAVVAKSTGGPIAVDETVRRSRAVNVTGAPLELMKRKLLELQPRAEAHFGEKLAGIKTPQFLSYTEGDFFDAHQDWNERDDYARERKVTLITFVNGEAEVADESSYAGGALVLYGLMGEHPPRHGMHLNGEPGLLVAFPADIWHEVKLVTGGHRYTVVTWYTG